MSANNGQEINFTEMVGMISSMAALDFSKRLDVAVDDNPINIMAYGLNMLSEELEQHVVRKSMLEETNANLEKFSYTVAHDIRSPLNSAIGITSLIEMELGKDIDPNVADYISLLKQIHQRMSDMIKGILEYSKSDFNALETEEIDIPAMCHDIAEEFDSRKVTIKYIMPETIPTIKYNRLAMWQVFSNLIGNAVKYNDKPVCEITFDYSDAGHLYELSIKDNGPGIPADKLDKVFDLFENFKSEDNNSYGVGLSIVKKIINQAGGSVWLDSRPGEGTRFTFTIAKN